MKKFILMGLLAAVFAIAPSAHAQQATSTDTGGANFSAALVVSSVCSEPGNPNLTWKVANPSYSAPQADYSYTVYAYGVGDYQTGSGVVNPHDSALITVPRKGELGSALLRLRSGRSDYHILVDGNYVPEDKTCYPAPTVSPVQASASVAPAENPQTIALMLRLIDLLKQLIALRLAR